MDTTNTLPSGPTPTTMTTSTTSNPSSTTTTPTPTTLTVNGTDSNNPPQAIPQSMNQVQDVTLPSNPTPSTPTLTITTDLPLLTPQSQPPQQQHQVDREQRERDAAKLFIGQIPRHVLEPDLRKLFEPFGEILELGILRDKHTQIHRGCAFLLYAHKSSAADAIANVHEKLSLHNRPIVVRYAGAANAPVECKLFVGMLGRGSDESHVTQLFTRFGQVKEVYLMRDQHSISKGCAFVKMNTKEEAIAAINELNDIYQDNGAPRKLVVRFADSKAVKARQQALSEVAALALNVTQHQQQQQQQHHQQQQLLHQSPSPHALQQQQQQQTHQQQYANAAAALLSNSGLTINTQLNNQLIAAAAAAASLSPQWNGQQHSWNINPFAQPFQPTQQQQQQLQQSSTTRSQPTNNTTRTQLNGQRQTTQPQTQQQQQAQQPLQFTFSYPTSPDLAAAAAVYSQLSPQFQSFSTSNYPPSVTLTPTHSAQSSISSLASHSQVSSPILAPARSDRGPPNANLFVYNLPEPFTDSDLNLLFQHFGPILSTHIFRDKTTGISRGFGFVSYDSPVSAEKAIANMNGYQLGPKRLKVMHKKSQPDPATVQRDQQQQQFQQQQLYQQQQQQYANQIAALAASAAAMSTSTLSPIMNGYHHH